MRNLATLRLCDFVFYPLRERWGELKIYIKAGWAGNRLANSQTRTPTFCSATSHHVCARSNISGVVEQPYGRWWGDVR